MVIHVGVLALQGAFSEHEIPLKNIPVQGEIEVIFVRTASDLDMCDALIIPGGESTSIALLARLSNLLDSLREFVRKKPVWGICAGAILLCQEVRGAKKGGQEVLGCIPITIERNGWGSQVASFEADLWVEDLCNPETPFKGVFIRAPVIVDPTPLQEPQVAIARLPLNLGPESTIVALRDGPRLLTTFHPELTTDHRFHEYFIRKCVLPHLLGSVGE